MSKPKAFIEASATGKSGTIRIVDRITEWSESSSSTIKRIVDDFLKDGVTDVEVYVNSAGGNCFEASEMCNDLDRLINKPTIKVGAVAASAATYFLTRFPSVCFPNSQFMIHRPKLGTYGDIISIKADLKLLENTTEDYKSAYSTKMNKTVEEIEAYFAQGDYWMTANEAKLNGLIDTILDQTELVTAESITILEACAAPIIPKIINEKLNKVERIKLISSLGLAADATDSQIEAALETLKDNAAKTVSLEASAKVQQEAKAEALVDRAIKEKKITADLKSDYVKLANTDFENTEKIINAMAGVTKASEELLEDGPSSEGREKWTMEDYQAKDPNALLEMMTKQPEAFKKLEAAYFG